MGFAPDLAVLILVVMALGLSLPLFLIVPLALTAIPWMPALPEGAALLASPWLAGPGALLLLISFLLDRVPGLRPVWRGLIAVAILPAAALLPFLVLEEGRPLSHFILAAILAVVLAAMLQATLHGMSLLRAWQAPWSVLPGGRVQAMTEGALVLTLVAGASFAPVPTALGAILVVGAAIWWYRPALRASRFVPTLLAGLSGHLSGAEGWKSRSNLPSWIPAVIDSGRPGNTEHPGNAQRPGNESEAEVEARPPAGAPSHTSLGGVAAGLASEGRVDGFRSGWLLPRDGSLRFMYQSAFRVWEVDLQDARPGRPDILPWGFRIPLTHHGSRRVLLVPRDGPEPTTLFGPGEADEDANPAPVAAPEAP